VACLMAWLRLKLYSLIQSIINKLYRYPRAEWKKIKKLGGYFSYREMQRNKSTMERASLNLPPVKSYPDGLLIYFLTGEKFLYQTLFCIASLSKVSAEKFRFILVDDGNFTDELIARIERQLPGAEIITKAIIDQNLEEKLPETNYPVLRKKRREYPHIKKLIDIHTLSVPGWKLVLDSDMLFFDEPLDMINWLKAPVNPLHMVDCENSYGYSFSLMEKLSGHKITEKANVGAIGMNSTLINWPELESWVKQMEELEGRSYYLEQALSVMLVAGKDCVILNKDQYIVNPDGKTIINGTGVLHHYVDLSKKGYYNTAWRKVV